MRDSLGPKGFITRSSKGEKKIKKPIETILLDHARRYPLWEVPDVYKLIHQAVMGSEHAIRNETAARQYLMEELDRMGKGPAEPLIDPLSPDGRIVRVHLRPMMKYHLAPDTVLHAFIRTGKEVTPSTSQLLAYAQTAIRLTQERQIALPESDLKDFVGWMQASGFLALSHSRAFEEAYRPAYRVVERGLLPPDWLAFP